MNRSRTRLNRWPTALLTCLTLLFVCTLPLTSAVALHPNDERGPSGEAASLPAGATPVPELHKSPTRPASSQPLSPRTGFVPPAMDLSHLTGRWTGPDLAATLPSFDWRARGKVSPVKNQGNCGACYAFASVGNFESKLLIDGAGLWDLSENHAKECNYEDASCGGGNFKMVANLFSQAGAVQDACDPYVADDVSCKTTCPYQKTVLEWRMVSGSTTPDTSVLKNYIQTYGPLYVSMYASFSAFDTYDGSYTLYYPTSQETDHAVLIVGWDDSLPHAGGTGGWIVKNSWGPNWGGTCGYGTEGGYFTIAYGSANIGRYASFIHSWQDYDSQGGLLYYDEGGWAGGVGCENTTAWGLVKLTPTSNTYARRVEFWTTDVTTDVDIYIYDDFDGSTLSNLLASKQDLAYNEAGYHSVALDSPLELSGGDDVMVAIKFSNASNTYPVPYDDGSPIETGRTYISCNGSLWTDWGGYGGDIAIRLRTSGMAGAPAAPSGLTATPSSPSQISLSWTDNSGDETGFVVERSPDGSIGWTPIVTLTANTSAYTDSGLTCNTPYYYRVHAYNAGGSSGHSNIAQATTLACPPPSAPSGLTATASSPNQIDLDWTDNSADETGFAVERSPDGLGGWTQIVTLTADTSTYADSGLACDTSYYYRVRAYRASAYSGYSNVADGKTTACPPGTPATPSTLTTTLASQTAITLTWQDNSTDEDGFTIDRSPDGSGWTHIVTLTADTNTYADSGLACSTSYYYRVRAYNATGYSGYSVLRTTTLPCDPRYTYLPVVLRNSSGQ